MPDDTNPGATPEVEGATPANGQAPSPGATPADETLGATGLAALQREREAREAATKERDALAKRIKAYEDRDKSEAEKNADRIAELEREVASERMARQSATVQVASISAARKLGYRDPDLAYRLVPSADVEFADDGTPKNLERILADLAKAHPSLVEGRSSGGDTGLGPRGTPARGDDDMNTLIRRASGRV